jgi:hypothetical protein
MRWVRAHNLFTGFALLAGLLVHNSSAHAAEDFDFFEKKIRPLFTDHCYKCHSGLAQTIQANFRLDTKVNLLAGGTLGPAIVPGDVENSLLIKAVRQTDPKFKMPPDQKLSDAQIADLEAWVKMGAPDPRVLVTQPIAASTLNLAEGKKWWAFQPVKDHLAPAVKKTDWAKRPLDNFVLAKLEQRNLAPAPQADKRTLIRRAYYDLIGLPPRPEEVEAFVADASPDAFAKVVDRLLAMPEYGQRWARRWLDVVRYTDSFDSRILGNPDSDAAFAWRYRDWVVDAFNADMPFDEFAKNQIAGDVLPGPTPGAMNKNGIVATGVYFIGEWGGGDADKEKLITDVVDDQVDLTGRAFLGLTVACARCHDHKFDPISTQDYYGLAGMFFSTHIFDNAGPKGGGPAIMKLPLADKAELAKRKADEVRVAEINQQISKIIDETIARQAKDMLDKVDQYLAAAWEFKNIPQTERPAIGSYAQQRNLQPYALTQWLNYVGLPQMRLFPKSVKDIGNTVGVSGWRNANDADTPVVWSNATDKPAQLLPGLVLPPNSLSVHPSPAAGVAIAWRSPISGKVKITGKVVDGHGVCGDGVAWSISRFGGSSPAGELASGTIANGGKQTLADGTGGKSLQAVDVSEGEMIQLAILPKADHSCDTTTVELTLTEVGGAGDTWDLIKDVVPTLTRANPHADSYGNPRVWHFHDMAGQAQAIFAAGSAMSRFTASVSAAAGTDGGAVRAAAEEVRKALETVAKDAATSVSPDASLYKTLTSPHESFWIAARPDESIRSAESRQQIASLRSEEASIKQNLTQPIPFAHAMQEGGTPASNFPGMQDVPVHIRGSYSKLGPIVPRRFPVVIAGENQPPIRQGSGRKELAEWIASEKNPLTSRVIANRIWQGHFGDGIVRSANNFGKLGSPPTNPELLDHLATRLTQLKWSIKSLHREIMLSAAYQQSSEGDPGTMKADPDNLLLGRMNRVRLDAEGLRDTLLAVADRLDRSLGGPAINDMNTLRRTLYVTTVRSDRANYRSLFDAADPREIVEKRIDSTVAPQALFLMNNPFALAQTQFLARRVMQQGGDTDAARIDWLYRLLLCRAPTAEEVEIGKAALEDARKPNGSDEQVKPEQPWEAYCQVLLCSNEFMYVD